MGSILESKANAGSMKKLADVLLSEHPLALIGAGMSVSAGYPSWSKLLNEMEKLLPESINKDYIQVLHDENDVLWRAEEYSRLIDKSDYYLFFRNRFSKPPNLETSDPIVSLIQLPFRHFITTNYDDVLLKAHETAKLQLPRVLNWSCEDDVRAFIFSLRDANATRFLLHLHGHHNEPESIIFTDNDYTNRYVRTFDTASKIFAIFTTERIVFAGFSLSDPDLMTLLREVNATMRSEEARHFAIIGLGDSRREILERQRLRKRYGVDPIFYDSSDNSHDGLIDILNFLHKSINLTGLPPDKQPTKTREFVGKKADEANATEIDLKVDPEDPQKGKWGGESSVNEREVRAKVREIEPDWFETTILVYSTNEANPLKGEVIFHLHPTIVPSVRHLLAENGIAQIVIESYGAYTVGIEADEGKTRLELDLSTLEGAPMMFRLN